MSSTPKLDLPLLAASQAQKHVTVNEALVRLDAVAALVLRSRSTPVPPSDPADGAVFAVPSGAEGAWQASAGRLAVWSNGGWIFLSPRRGWQAWIEDEHTLALFDGLAWRGGAIALSASGAGSFFRVKEFDHVVMPGAQSVTNGLIPAATMVFAVTARVISPLAATPITWRLGNEGADDRFGSGLGSGAGSFARGLLSFPLSYFQATPLIMTAEDGAFDGGTIRFSIHYYEPSLPAA